jgi:hypothetical protein
MVSFQRFGATRAKFHQGARFLLNATLKVPDVREVVRFSRNFSSLC